MKQADIHPVFTVVPIPVIYQKPAALFLEDFLSAYPFAPAEYVELISEINGFYLEYPLHEGKFTLSVDSLEDVLNFPSDYAHLNEMRTCFFFGTDGDIIYFYAADPEHKVGIYCCELAGMDWEEAEWLAASFRAFFAEGEGILERHH